MGSVLVVGPIPPPVDGRAVATGWLVDALRPRVSELVVVDTQLSGRWTGFRKVFRCARAAWSILHTPPDRVVVVASGGLGLIGEVLPLLAARWRARPMALVHHSASYVRSSSAPMRLVVAVTGSRVTHVTLGPTMRRMLIDQYALAPSQCVVVDNAALMPVREVPAVPRHRRLLHLSNLSAEKGSLVVIEVARGLGSTLADPQVRLAGPADAEVRMALDEAAASGVGLEWVGPVDEGGKAAELAGARGMILPTTYHHEAQPLVVYEAAAMGAVPIVWATGWLVEQMRGLGLDRFVFAPGDVDGLTEAARQLLALSDAAFEELAAEVRASHLDLVAHSRSQVDAILG